MNTAIKKILRDFYLEMSNEERIHFLQKTDFDDFERKIDEILSRHSNTIEKNLKTDKKEVEIINSWNEISKKEPDEDEVVYIYDKWHNTVEARYSKIHAFHGDEDNMLGFFVTEKMIIPVHDVLFWTSLTKIINAVPSHEMFEDELF
jgi:hypothetical protein